MSEYEGECPIESDTPMDLLHVASVLQKFSGADLTATLSNIENLVRGITASNCSRVLATAGANNEALAAAAVLKRVAGQVNVAIHAIGILLCLTHLLDPDEQIEYVSLGAGNTGREFDLETNQRIAEFKFIRWRGGAESIRQNQTFKDFYLLAESQSTKQKYLYVLGTEMPLKFLNANRSLESVLSRNVKLLRQFQKKYGRKYVCVRDYYLPHKHLVAIEDVSGWVPELIEETPEAEED
jgi:hypothetical protein